MRRAKLKKGVFILPNLCTIGSLFCGFYSVIMSLKVDFERAAWAIVLAGLFDFLDGQVARLTKSQSEFGVQLDSLVDAGSFGFAPSVLIYTWSLYQFERIGWIGAFVFFACGVLRLARFNVQAGNVERTDFQGLPIPSGAGMLIAWVLFYDQYLAESFINPEWITLFIAVLAAMLMVSPIRYRSLKGVDMTGKKPFYYLVGVIAILTLVALEPPLVLFLVGVTYLSSGVLEAGYRVWTRGRPGFNRPSKHPAASRLKGVDGDGKQTDRLRRLY